MPPALKGSAGTAVASAASVANPTNLTPGIPAHAAGDLLLCFTTSYTKSAAAPTVATPSGWTALANLTPELSGFFARMAVFGKIAASSSETTPTVTWSGLNTGNSGTPVQAQCAVFTGMQASLTGIVEVTGAVETVNGGIPPPSGTAITTSTNNDLVLSIANRVDDAGTWAAPTGFTMIGTAATTSGLDKAFAWAYQVKSSAGSVSPDDFTLTGGVGGNVAFGYLIALKPAVTASTVERAAAVSGTGAISSAGQGTLVRAATIAGTGAVATNAVFWTTLERAAAASAVGAIQSAGEVTTGPEEVERSAAVNATAAIATSGRLVIARSAAVNATAAIVSIGSEGLARTAALTASAAVNTAAIKVAPRQAALAAAAAISSSGEVTGAPEIVTGQADLAAAGTVATAGTVTAPQTVTAAASLAATATIEVTISGGAPPPTLVGAGRILQQRPRIVEAAAHLHATGRIETANEWIPRPLSPVVFARAAEVTATASVDVSSRHIQVRTGTATLAGFTTLSVRSVRRVRYHTASARFRLQPSILASATTIRYGYARLDGSGHMRTNWDAPLTDLQRDEELLLLLIGDDL